MIQLIVFHTFKMLTAFTIIHDENNTYAHFAFPHNPPERNQLYLRLVRVIARDLVGQTTCHACWS